MAKYGEIKSDMSMPAGKTIRRNAADDGFETFTAGASTSEWGGITGTLSAQTDLDSALNGKQATMGADDNYVTDAEKVVVGNTTGTNSGDSAGHAGLEPANANIQAHVTAAHAPLQAWPVGSVFVAVVNTSPATLLGYGTWAAFGAGRVLIGRDAGDPDFDVAEETGGAKKVAATAQAFTGTQSTVVVNHVHTLATGSGATGNFSQVIGTVDTSSGGTGATPTQTALGTRSGNPVGGAAGYTPAGTNASGAATSVIQPYIVVYLWKRTA